MVGDILETLRVTNDLVNQMEAQRENMSRMLVNYEAYINRVKKEHPKIHAEVEDKLGYKYPLKE